MASILPPFPRFVLTIFEPIALIGGFFTALFSTRSFIAEQYPYPLSALAPTKSAEAIALQLGNVYLLLALLGLFILNTTTDPRVVKAYVLALAIADVGHVAVTGRVLGWERTIDVRGWNQMAWGNIGVTVGLFITRIGYLAGVFGAHRSVGKAKVG